MKPTKEERADSLEFLRGLLKPGDKVHTILRHVSRSGMSRRISTIYIKDGKPMDISPGVARVLELPCNYNQEGMRIGGCGMDMGFEIVYLLGRCLFPDGFKTWEGYWRNEPLGYDQDGGYALKQEWL